MDRIQIVQLRHFADMASPMPWEANDSTVPHLAKAEFQKYATPQLIGALLDELQSQRERLDEVHSWVVCAPIAAPDDMAQNFERIEKITSPDYKAPL